jgi:multisubunit Na+/H+ antiporter MnhE subunit
MARRVAYWAADFGVLLGVWLLLVMTTEPAELAAGAGAAALAALGMELAREQQHPQFAPRLRDLTQFYRIPASVAEDTVALLVKLPKRPEGFFRLLPFYFGGDSAADGGRRALAIIYATIPPNTLVIGIERQRNRMLVHYVAEAKVPESIRRLGAAPGEHR